MTFTLLLIALGVIAFLLGALVNAKADQRQRDRLIRDLTVDVGHGLSPEEFRRQIFEAEENRVQLNSEGFISGLNEDIRKALQCEEIDAKIEAWHDSDYSGPLHEYLGMTEEEYAAFVEQREASGIVEKLPITDRNNPREPA